MPQLERECALNVNLLPELCRLAEKVRTTKDIVEVFQLQNHPRLQSGMLSFQGARRQQKRYD